MTQKAKELAEAYDRAVALRDIRDKVVKAQALFKSDGKDNKELLDDICHFYDYSLYKCLQLDEDNFISIYDTELYKQLGRVIHFMQLLDGGDNKVDEFQKEACFFVALCDTDIHSIKLEIQEAINEL